MKKFTVKQLALNGVVAALYAALTILTASFAYGPVQFRLYEALCVLVCFEPTLTVGLTLGCPAEEMDHLQRVLDTFEQFCTVSQSIQSGVKVNVSVQDTEGKMLKATEV